MKRIFLFLTAITALTFAACEGETSSDNEFAFVLKSDNVLEVASSSGAGLILYSLDNPTPTGELVATADVDWITSFDYSEMGSVKFRILENQQGSPRTATITLSYETIAYNISVTQAASDNPADKTIVAPMVVGQYFGTITPGYINYYIAFSDKGMASNEVAAGINYWGVPDAYYYILDIFCDLDHTPTNEGFNIPDGTYPLGMGGTYNTINFNTSWLQYNDAAGHASSENQIDYQSATLTVEGNKLTFEAVMFTNERVETHTVTYEGEYSLLDMTQIY